MKLGKETKILIKKISHVSKIEAWIKDEQRRIDVDKIDLENEIISGNRHNYAPWVDGMTFDNGKWYRADTMYRIDVSLEKISLLEFKKKIDNNQLIIGIK